jgi:hypothetical protein
MNFNHGGSTGENMDLHWRKPQKTCAFCPNGIVPPWQSLFQFPFVPIKKKVRQEPKSNKKSTQIPMAKDELFKFFPAKN